MGFSHVQAEPRALMERHDLIGDNTHIFYAENYPAALEKAISLLEDKKS